MSLREENDQLRLELEELKRDNHELAQAVELGQQYADELHAELQTQLLRAQEEIRKEHLKHCKHCQWAEFTQTLSHHAEFLMAAPAPEGEWGSN